MARKEGSTHLGSPTQKQTTMGKKKFPFEGRQTKPTKESRAKPGMPKAAMVKDKPHVEEVGKGVGVSSSAGKMEKRTAKRPEPDNAPPARSSAKVTPTTKAGAMKQVGSKAEKRLRDIRI